jgi:hypothetical protein
MDGTVYDLPLYDDTVCRSYIPSVYVVRTGPTGALYAYNRTYTVLGRVVTPSDCGCPRGLPRDLCHYATQVWNDYDGPGRHAVWFDTAARADRRHSVASCYQVHHWQSSSIQRA